jgi:hypothetical protein
MKSTNEIMGLARTYKWYDNSDIDLRAAIDELQNTIMELKKSARALITDVRSVCTSREDYQAVSESLCNLENLTN